MDPCQCAVIETERGLVRGSPRPVKVVGHQAPALQSLVMSERSQEIFQWSSSNAFICSRVKLSMVSSSVLLGQVWWVGVAGMELVLGSEISCGLSVTRLEVGTSVYSPFW